MQLPPSWSWFPDEAGGAAVFQPAGQTASSVLHIHVEGVDDSESLPNLSRMLAGFLTLRGRPVATDDLLELDLPNTQAFAWQYQEGEQAVRVWVAGNELAWAFINFHCPVLLEAELRSDVDLIVASLVLRD